MYKCLAGCDYLNEKICCIECKYESCNLRCNLEKLNECKLLRKVDDEKK